MKSACKKMAKRIQKSQDGIKNGLDTVCCFSDRLDLSDRVEHTVLFPIFVVTGIVFMLLEGCREYCLDLAE
jgi:hypothetical protein